MRTLAVTNRQLVSRTSGYDIRVLHLCDQTRGEVDLLAVPLVAPDPSAATLDVGAVFDHVEVLPPLLEGPLSPRRHLRTSDEDYLALASPDAVRAARDRVRSLVVDRGVDRVVAFGIEAAQVARAVETLSRPVPWFLEACDSHSLILRRRRAEASYAGPAAALRSRLELVRGEAMERGLARRACSVATVSDADTRRIQELAGPAVRVTTVGNGIDPALLRTLGEPGSSRRVGFWGNLSFEPNEDALRFYLEQVHAPHLRPAGVGLTIVGPNAPAWLEAAADSDDSVELLGFVPDLWSAIADVPVMINPMRLGSGVKNKVLEAFGMGLAVVSTSRGAEGVAHVRDGVEVSLADDPADLAARTLLLLDDRERLRAQRDAARALVEAAYGWDRAGEAWNAFLDDAAAVG